MEPAFSRRQENPMISTADRCLVVDKGFDRTVETVLQAFLNAGFSVTPIEGGDLHQKRGPSGRLRYALLEATLPELCSSGVVLARVSAGDSRLPHLDIRGHQQLQLRDDVESAGTLPAAGLARATPL